MIMNKAPEYIWLNNRLYRKKIFDYKYKTKPALYGYKGIYESISNHKNLIEIVELAKWQVENALLEYLKCRCDQ